MNKDPYKDIHLQGLKIIPITKEQEQDIRHGITIVEFQDKYPQTPLKWYLMAESHIRNEKVKDPFLRATLNHYMDALLEPKIQKAAEKIMDEDSDEEMTEETRKMIEEENEPSK